MASLSKGRKAPDGGRWRAAATILTRGHGVASGAAGDPRYPGGTIRMQQPAFAARGLDLSGFHPATLNLSLAPWSYRPLAPRHRFAAMRWHPEAPPEDFSFFDCLLEPVPGRLVPGLVYYPHPETKPEHHQPPGILEVLAPFIPGLRYGEPLLLRLDPRQIELLPP